MTGALDLLPQRRSPTGVPSKTRRGSRGHPGGHGRFRWVKRRVTSLGDPAARFLPFPLFVRLTSLASMQDLGLGRRPPRVALFRIFFGPFDSYQSLPHTYKDMPNYHILQIYHTAKLPHITNILDCALFIQYVLQAKIPRLSHFHKSDTHLRFPVSVPQKLPGRRFLRCKGM